MFHSKFCVYSLQIPELSLLTTCCRCVLEDCGWVWDVVVPLSAGDGLILTDGLG